MPCPHTQSTTSTLVRPGYRASGGRTYKPNQQHLAADRRAQDAQMDAGELLHEQVRLVFADFRAWFAESTNALRSNILDTMEDGYVPF